MNSTIFYRKIVKHELYSCSILKNQNQLIKVLSFTATIKPRKSNLSNITILLAVLQLVFNKRSYVKFITVNSVKKLYVYSQYLRISKIATLKENLFSFTFFKQQKILPVDLGGNLSFFFNFDVLMFSVLIQYYRFIFSTPRIRLTLKTSNLTKQSKIKALVFGSFLRLPL
jgi:hypothetical protein